MGVAARPNPTGRWSPARYYPRVSFADEVTSELKLD
jgi:hypothetical protein